jgi:hypothetical protein
VVNEATPVTLNSRDICFFCPAAAHSRRRRGCEFTFAFATSKVTPRLSISLRLFCLCLPGCRCYQSLRGNAAAAYAEHAAFAVAATSAAAAATSGLLGGKLGARLVLWQAFCDYAVTVGLHFL